MAWLRKLTPGKDLESVLRRLGEVYGDAWDDAAGDVYKVLIDKAEAEAYENIKMVKPGDGMTADGVPLVHGRLRVRPRRAGEEVDAPRSSEERRGSLGERRGVAG